MKLIVGLGNKGKEYDNTRHNVGFMAIDRIAQQYDLEFNKEKFNGLYAELNVSNQKIILLKPQKYMNLSGEVIKKYIDFYKFNIEDILIISDDLDLEVGTYKLKLKGGSGGHNGLKNIESNLKTKDYKRIKIGISNNKQIETKDYVLGKFDKETKSKIDDVLQNFPEIFKDYLELSFENLMNKYNR